MNRKQIIYTPIAAFIISKIYLRLFKKYIMDNEKIIK